ncbi:hypothetical protein BDQ17DRAFT_1406924 [Cyathus striatus]|nr:hypothetical protein BDQ17DRAFT_1406924 [Cyathus striatus]
MAGCVKKDLTNMRMERLYRPFPNYRKSVFNTAERKKREKTYAKTAVARTAKNATRKKSLMDEEEHLDYAETAMVRRRCPTCGSKQWHKEPSSGLIACSEGHILQNYRNETTEVEEMGPHAMRKRTLKSGRKKKDKTSHADPKLYHGARGRYHYFLCQQLILRKQIAALTKLWDLPCEFEASLFYFVVCRDIWALHLSLLPNPPPDEPHTFVDDKILDKDTGMIKTGSMPTPPLDRLSEVSPDSKVKESEGEDETKDSEDSEMEDLMLENSEISSSSDDGEGNMEGPSTRTAVTKKGGKGQHRYESPASTIAVLVVACWTLRLPVLYRDFARVIESYELPYLEAIRILPDSMLIHLTQQNKQALSPYHAPRTRLVHGLASRLGKRLYSSYGVLTPEANGAPILWRVVKAMGGSPTLYGLTKRLCDIVSLPLTLHETLGPAPARIGKLNRGRHKYDSVAPEVGMVAVCIMVLKMVYGLDGKTRLPRGVDDPAWSLPEGGEFLKRMAAIGKEERERAEGVFSSENGMSVGDASDEMIDEYISFCARALLSARREHRRKENRGGEDEDRGIGRVFSSGNGEGGRMGWGWGWEDRKGKDDRDGGEAGAGRREIRHGRGVRDLEFAG